VLAVLAGVVVGVGVFMAWRMAQPYVEQAGEYLAGMRRLTELADLDRQVADRTPYAPDASGELTAVQVERFVRVQEQMRASLGARVGDVRARYQDLQRELDAGRRTLSFAEAASALSDLSAAFVDARRAQVEMLNAEGFSQGEYEWVRTRVYQAAGLEIAGLSLSDLQRLSRDTGDAGIELAEAVRADVPDRNRELVRPYVSRLQEWLPLIFFGF
jgi:hypothetical protein